MSLWLQYAVVFAAVAVSACYVIAKQWPRAVRRARVALAVPLVRDGRPAWLRALGHRIAPSPESGNGCGGCTGCGPEPPATVHRHPPR